jgi:hypothetical protein
MTYRQVHNTNSCLSNNKKMSSRFKIYKFDSKQLSFEGD